jgi:hypothetical protein
MEAGEVKGEEDGGVDGCEVARLSCSRAFFGVE